MCQQVVLQPENFQEQSFCMQDLKVCMQDRGQQPSFGPDVISSSFWIGTRLHPCRHCIC